MIFIYHITYIRIIITFITSDTHLVHDPIESMRELANIALGRGAAIISDHLGDFIKMNRTGCNIFGTFSKTNNLLCADRK
jgi:chemotaxis protein CheY-P-specific phosphatase CheC